MKSRDTDVTETTQPQHSSSNDQQARGSGCSCWLQLLQQLLLSAGVSHPARTSLTLHEPATTDLAASATNQQKSNVDLLGLHEVV